MICRLRIPPAHPLWPALALGAAVACAPSPVTVQQGDPGAPVDLVSYADPFIGTGGVGYAVGCLYPGAGRPMSMVKVSPDTADRWGSYAGFYRGGGYHYGDVNIDGFSHMHLSGTGLTDYGVLAFMPVSGASLDDGQATLTTRSGRRALFDHDREHARPGSYEVILDETGILVELSATDHTALHRYTFPVGLASPTVLLDLAHANGNGEVTASAVDVDPDSGVVTGWLTMDGEMSNPFTVHFAAVFDQPPQSWGTWADGEVGPGDTSAEATGVGAWFRFAQADADAPRVVHARVAISTVDSDGPWTNLDAEAPETGTADIPARFDLDGLRVAAEADWRDWLSPVRVWGGSERDRILLGTALYHALQMPTTYSDADGRYTGFDKEIHSTDGWRYTTDLSLWDTYRTLHPLMTLVWPDAQRDVMRSMTRMVQEGGGMPLWALAHDDSQVMLGMPAHVVLGETLQKGLTDLGEDVLLPHAVDVALGRTSPPYGGRPDVTTWQELGYYPADQLGRSVAWTQEVAISEAALAGAVEWAADNGHGLDDDGRPYGISQDDVDQLWTGSGSWANLYDDDVGFFHGRNTDGSWVDFESELGFEDDYAEGNAWQYLWLAPHDPEGLINRLGGADAFVERLTWFFEGQVEWEEVAPAGSPGAYYWHGNEPDIHAAWLFALAGRPDLTRTWVDSIVDTKYNTRPSGIPGNDDAGTMSAWYAFAAFGLYPLNGTDRYVLGDPRFPRIELDVVGADGRAGVFTILRLGSGPVVGVSLDGAWLDTPDIRHDQLRPGGNLVFVGDDLLDAFEGQPSPPCNGAGVEDTACVPGDTGPDSGSATARRRP